MIISALLQPAAFLFPTQLFWLSFVALVPLFAHPLRGSSFRKGFRWGLVFYGLFFLGLLPFLNTFAHGFLRFVPYFVLVVYFSCLAGAWFFLAHYLHRYMHHCFAWAVATMIYAFFMEYVSLLPFGQCNGVPLTNILVPMAEHTSLIIPTFYVGVIGVTALLIFAQALIAYALSGRLSLWIAALAYVPFVCGFFIPCELPPSALAQVGYLKPTPGQQEYVCDVAVDVARRIELMRATHPRVALILMPEGSFRCPLHRVCAAVDTITQAGQGIELVFGSHRVQEGRYHNCMYQVSNRILRMPYDKELCVPFAEYVPEPWSRIPKFCDLFLDGYEPLTPSLQSCSVCDLRVIKVIPQICYDLYFRSAAPVVAAGPEVSILLLTNDFWYPAYMQRLLLLLARMRAVAWGRDIWYIAHTGGLWLGKRGGIAILQSLP
jgi:apolipoprotein N-acyltransferase